MSRFFVHGLSAVDIKRFKMRFHVLTGDAAHRAFLSDTHAAIHLARSQADFGLWLATTEVRSYLRVKRAVQHTKASVLGVRSKHTLPHLTAEEYPPLALAAIEDAKKQAPGNRRRCCGVADIGSRYPKPRPAVCHAVASAAMPRVVSSLWRLQICASTKEVCADLHSFHKEL